MSITYMNYFLSKRSYRSFYFNNITFSVVVPGEVQRVQEVVVRVVRVRVDQLGACCRGALRLARQGGAPHQRSQLPTFTWYVSNAHHPKLS